MHTSRIWRKFYSHAPKGANEKLPFIKKGTFHVLLILQLNFFSISKIFELNTLSNQDIKWNNNINDKMILFLR